MRCLLSEVCNPDAQGTLLELVVEGCRSQAEISFCHLRPAIGATLWRATMVPGCAHAIPSTRLGGRPRRPSFVGLPGHVGMPAGSGSGTQSATRADPHRRHEHPGPSQCGQGGHEREALAQRTRRETLDRSRGGSGTRACVAADSLGRVVVVVPAPEQRPAICHTRCRDSIGCRVFQDGSSLTGATAAPLP